MKVLENERNLFIYEQGDYIYFISYNTPIAKVNNKIRLEQDKNEYGLYLTNDWDYSQTTLKQLYNFIELYTTQRDETGNMISYILTKEKNKKQYIKNLIDKKIIKIIEREVF